MESYLNKNVRNEVQEIIGAENTRTMASIHP